MSNFIKLNYISNKKIDHHILHSLYTSIRFKNEKILNLNEKFKVWMDGRNVFIVMEKIKIENLKKEFEFKYQGEIIKLKLFREEDFVVENIKNDEYVRVSGIISYAYKERFDDITKEICPVDFKGNIKNKSKFAHYLTQKTGLDFESVIADKDRVMVSRLYWNDIGINDNENKKVMLKNMIMIDAIVNVLDENKLKDVLTSSIGKKRSYGMGNLIIEKVS